MARDPLATVSLLRCADVAMVADELTRVVRLIGIEKKINIAGMVVPPLRGGEDCVAVMHLQVDEPSEIVHALRGITLVRIRAPRTNIVVPASSHHARRALRPWSVFQRV
jgi:hypothetical protein